MTARPIRSPESTTDLRAPRSAAIQALLSVQIADNGLRKRAYLFGEQVKARYGEDGWNCTQHEPTSEQQPIGGAFVNEHCEKANGERRLVLDRELHRQPGRDLGRGGRACHSDGCLAVPDPATRYPVG